MGSTASPRIPDLLMEKVRTRPESNLKFRGRPALHTIGSFASSATLSTVIDSPLLTLSCHALTTLVPLPAASLPSGTHTQVVLNQHADRRQLLLYRGCCAWVFLAITVHFPSQPRRPTRNESMFRKRPPTDSGNSWNGSDPSRCEWAQHLLWDQPSENSTAPSEKAESRRLCEDIPRHRKREL